VVLENDIVIRQMIQTGVYDV